MRKKLWQSQTIEDATVEVEEEDELKEKNNYTPETEADSSTVTALPICYLTLKRMKKMKRLKKMTAA